MRNLNVCSAPRGPGGDLNRRRASSLGAVSELLPADAEMLPPPPSAGEGGGRGDEKEPQVTQSGTNGVRTSLVTLWELTCLFLGLLKF